MTNKNKERGVNLRLTVASTVKSGDVVMIGKYPFVASTDYSATDGKASLDREGKFNLSVQAVDDAGNIAVAVGDDLYYTSSDTPVLSKKRSGVYFGIALAAITSGSTATIEILLAPSGGGGTNAPSFSSTEQTGTGSAQNVAHGLGVVPKAVIVWPTDTSPSTTGVYVVTEGTHTSTNVVVTVTSGKKFKVAAWA